MNRVVAALFTVATLANAARADVPPPPLPMGKKHVSIKHEVVLGEGVTGYVFVEESGHGTAGAPLFVRHKIELTPGKPTAVQSGRYNSLYAIPQDEAKKFKTDEELCAALGKVQGVHGIALPGTTTVSSLKVLGNSVTWTHTISVDAKGELHTTVKGEGVDPPAEREDSRATGSQPARRTGPFRSCGSGVGTGFVGISLAWGIMWIGTRFARRSRSQCEDRA